MRVVYLASPIDAVPDEKTGLLVQVMREEARSRLLLAGVVVYDPSEAWQIGQGQYEPDGRVWTVNECAMQMSDGLLALLPSEASSVGVPMEIEMARRLMLDEGNRKVAVVGNREWSFALRAEGIDLFTGKHSVEEAVNYLVGK